MRVPAGLVVRDAAGDGVLRVVADGVRLEFEEGSVLRGAPVGALGDQREGVGISVLGRRDVVVSGARLEGFRVGLLAREADGLLVEDVLVRDGFRQRLRSTAAAADDGADWLAPHDNDERQWVTRHGAALCVERTDGATIRRCTARDVQNGLILDRVSDARVYDDDFSFLSGWGLAMWRSSGCSVTRNALDFCIRGYSHGVYNRGQDSAGLLLFEQCHDNLFAENSITHGGDGVFAFSGREALGELAGDDAGPGAFEGRGHRGNLFLRNDLSFAAAHGLELTFAQTNRIEENTFEGNAICGVWGGYSRDLLVVGNTFRANGDAGYGLERGGVNIEHGAHDTILGNRFEDNRCGVHLWWDEDAHLATVPWVRDHGAACEGNVVADNDFVGDEVALHLRACRATAVVDNRFEGVGTATVVEGEAPVDDAGAVWAVLPRLAAPSFPPRTRLRGDTRPVGARPVRRGREAILMTEWGPWDGEAVAWRPLRRAPHEVAWELLGAGDAPFAADDASVGVAAPDVGDGVVAVVEGARVTVRAADGRRGLLPWRLEVPGAPPLSGTLLVARWEVTAFPSPCDPREDEARWRAGATADGAVRETLGALDLPYGGGGPGQQGWARDDFPPDHFGTLAVADIPLPAGRWRLATLSDDGLRVRVDGELLVDEWTWHAPTAHEAFLELEEPREVHVEVEHFELDGWSVLRVAFEPAPADD